MIIIIIMIIMIAIETVITNDMEKKKCQIVTTTVL